jgi:hypothetical protein
MDKNAFGALIRLEGMSCHNSHNLVVEPDSDASSSKFHAGNSFPKSLTLRSVSHDQNIRIVSGSFSAIMPNRCLRTDMFRWQNALVGRNPKLSPWVAWLNIGSEPQ